MSAIIAGKLITTAIESGVKALEVAAKPQNRAALYTTLHSAAEAGVLHETAKDLATKFPDLLPKIKSFLKPPKAGEYSLLILNEAGKAFRAIREANPVILDKII